MDEKKAHTKATMDTRVPMKNQGVVLTDAITNLDDALSQLKALNALFKEIQDMLTTFADNSREGIVLMQENKFIWVNKAACKISGYTFDEILSLKVPDITAPGHRDKLIARMNMVLAGDHIDEPQEWPILRKDRILRFVRIFSYRVIFGRKPAIVAFFYDITENKRIFDESVMRAQILDSINDHVALADFTGKIVYANDAICESLGYSKEELLNMNILDITAPEFRGKAGIRLKQASEHKEARFDTMGLRKDGLKVNLEVRAKIINQGGKQFVLMVGRENQTENNGRA